MFHCLKWEWYYVDLSNNDKRVLFYMLYLTYLSLVKFEMCVLIYRPHKLFFCQKIFILCLHFRLDKARQIIFIHIQSHTIYKTKKMIYSKWFFTRLDQGIFLLTHKICCRSEMHCWQHSVPYDLSVRCWLFSLPPSVGNSDGEESRLSFKRLYPGTCGSGQSYTF